MALDGFMDGAGIPLGIGASTTDPATGAIMTPMEGGVINVTHPDTLKPGKSNIRKGDFNANLAEDDTVPLAAISAYLMDAVQADDAARREWVEGCNKGRDYLGIKWEDVPPDASQGSVSRVNHTLLLEAVMRSWANSRSELLPADGPVKVRDDYVALGNDEPAPPQPQAMPGAPPPPTPPTRSQLAEAFQKDFNYYLTVGDPDYYPDFSRMLMSRAGVGTAFRKVFYDPVTRRPISRWVEAENIIASTDSSSLHLCARVTERITMTKALVRRMMVNKRWRDTDLTPQAPGTDVDAAEQNKAEVSGINLNSTLNSDDWTYTIYETMVELDDGPLAEDETGKAPGFPLPYRVTWEKNTGEILEIRRNWRKGDENYERRRRYVKYGFVPGIGPGVYDLGFFHILGNPERAATAFLRMLSDAGQFASFPGGMVAKTGATKTDKISMRAGPGQWVVVDTQGQPLKDFCEPFPYKEPSPTLAALLGETEKNAKNLSGILETAMGEGRVGDVPATTMMAMVEAVAKVPSAIHKDDHMAQQEEFELLRELIAEDPSVLTRFAKKPARAKWIAEEFADLDLTPASDPNVASSTHRLMQATNLVQLAAQPQFAPQANQKEVFIYALNTLGISNADRFIAPPQAPAPPQPDPKIVAAQIKAQADQAKAAASAQQTESNNQTKIATLQMQAQQRAADRVSEEWREATRAGIAQAKLQQDARQHAVDTMSDHLQQVRQHQIDETQHQRDTMMDALSLAQQAQQPAPQGASSEDSGS